MSFWSSFEQASCYPSKCQCEAPLDALIRQPSAFWSSLSYVVAGLAIYYIIRPRTYNLKLWSWVCILMGLSSLLGHGTYIRLALAMDFASIILVLSFFALLNLFLMLKQSSGRIMVYFTVYYLALYFAMYSMSKWAKIGTCIIIFAFSIGDVMREMGLKFLKAKDLQISLLTLSISFVLFLMDENHFMCDPKSIYQWHSLWHLGSALSMYYYGKWRFSKSIEPA